MPRCRCSLPDPGGIPQHGRATPTAVVPVLRPSGQARAASRATRPSSSRPCALRNASTKLRSRTAKSGSGSSRPASSRRVVQRAAQYEPGHRVEVGGRDLATEPHRLQRNRPAARKRIEHPRRTPPERLPDLVPQLLKLRVALTAPVQDARPPSRPSACPPASAAGAPRRQFAPSTAGAPPRPPGPAVASPTTPPGKPPTAAEPARCEASRYVRAGRSSREPSPATSGAAGRPPRSAGCRGSLGQRYRSEGDHLSSTTASPVRHRGSLAATRS